MAEGKKSFVLYSDIIHTVKKLPNNKAGELFKLILSYVNDENPTTKDLAVDLVFEPIKQQLKRDLKQWEETRGKRSEAGKLGGRPKKQDEAKEANAFPEKQTEANKAVNGNGIVNVNDNVNVNGRESRTRYPIEECLRISLVDTRFVKANKCNQHELELFNNYLEKTGRYDFDPLDYKKYFSTIKDLYPNLLKKELSIEDLKEIARQMDEKQKLKAV